MRMTESRSTLTVLFAVLWACLSSTSVDATVNATPAPPDASACSIAVASVSDLNAPALFAGSVSCAEEGRQEDTNFLLIVGQIRAVSDLIILTPLNDADVERAASLYAEVFYQFGGLGFDELYRTPAIVSALEQRIRETALPLPTDYYPGWSFRPSSKTDIYADIIANQREFRIWQMLNFALLMQDDEYYAAHLARNELLAKNNGTVVAGTPAAEELGRIEAQLREAERDIPQLPPPEDTTPYTRLNEQDPALAGRQVAIGFNGPASGPDTLILRSEEEVRESWLASALSSDELASLLSGTDFSQEALVVLSIGRRVNASGQLVLSELSYDVDPVSGFGGWQIGARVGVVPETCGVGYAKSYPFMIAAIEAGPNARILGLGISNFPDECGPVATGAPVAGR